LNNNLQEKIKKLSEPLGEFISCIEMTPDASQRRYYRLALKNPNGEAISAVVMQFLSTTSPEASGGIEVSSDEACVSLTNFYREHKVAVPKLYVDARDESILIIEDLGDRTLGEILLKQNDNKEVLFEYYSKAIDQILAIQEISHEKIGEHFAFKRSFSEQQYIKEMEELFDYSFSRLSINNEDLGSYFPFLAKELSALPTILSHRDFHSWNIIIDSNDDIRVIDFQDSLMATRCYDLVSLLNDRDTDSYLGVNLYQKLLSYFYEKISFKEDFFFEYNRVLLQRDIKVVGRFAKLSSERGLKHYEQWIPGTLKRIGCTLGRLSKSKPEYADFLDVLVNTYPEVAAGALLEIPFLESEANEG